MTKEICISSTPHETRLAILEEDQLAEIYYERENEYTLAGSIYNGRVTRVLPGMQSAFVDIGLERDAFLYVTDFIELEDQEETDELEKAAASGAGQAPRAVRPAVPERDSRQEAVERAGKTQEPKRRPELQQEAWTEVTATQVQAAIPAAKAAPSNAGQTSAAATPAASAPAAGEQESAGGTRRWRGRRRRRGSRGTGTEDVAQPAAPEEIPGSELPDEHEMAGEIHASGAIGEQEAQETPVWQEKPERTHPQPERARPTQVAPAPRGGQAFVLPGESLSKYGGAPVEESPQLKTEIAEARPAVTSKPSTLIEAPIEWDPESGLLPGESISRRGARKLEAADAVTGEAAPAVLFEPAAETSPETVADETPIQAAARDELEPVRDEFVEEELVEEAEEFSASEDDEFTRPETGAGPPVLDSDEEELEEELVEEEADLLPGGPEAESDFQDTEATAPETAPNEEEGKNEEGAEPGGDAYASHRVDPMAPQGFRLFGFGKKKEKEEAKPQAASVPSVSAFAPGQGLVEEEVIEGDEFEVSPRSRQHKPDMHEQDDLEEKTLAKHLRARELGDLFEEKSGEEGPEADEGEEETTGSRSAGATFRRERGGRARRGRGASPQDGRRGMTRRAAQTSDLPVISDLLKPGQEILVQIAKEPIAKKGARITSHIALPGRFLVFMPTVSHVGVSRKIASDEERHRLKRILTHERGQAQGGFIVRTAAEGASEEELRSDLRFLMNLWNEIKQRSDSSKSPALIYHDLSLVERILRDQVSANFSNIWVDSQDDYERIVRFLNRFSPSLVRRVKLYTKETPLFEHFGIEDEISKALRSKVWLKSGGSIVINQTEALVAIDINTGKYVGKSARLEDTILKTNLDAVPEIVRQIRLRDLGGIIVIDFIDMDERKNRFKVMAALEEALKSDRAPTKVLQFNDFGLVAITRKRVKQSLERTLSVPCPICQATGMVKSPTTVCNEIYIEMRKMKKHFENADVMLRVHPETLKVLKGNNGRWLSELEDLVGKNILPKGDATLQPEQFDIQG
jgi:ribonuclease G